MKFFKWMKDGGPQSHVTGLYMVEIKSLFSIVLLRFTPGSRDAYHSHAFDARTWVLRGKFVEHMLSGKQIEFVPSFKPKKTPRSTFHKVVSEGVTWALSFRGPWANTWREWLPDLGFRTLTHGRKVVG